MTPRLLDFIFHFPLCLTFTYIFFVPFVRFLFYLFLLKIFGLTFLCVHIKRRTCALKFLVSKRRITLGYCATFRGEGHEGI